MEKKKRVMDMRRFLSTRAGSLSAGRLQLRGLRLVATLLACFVLPCLVLVALQPNMGSALSLLTLQSTRTSLHIQVVEAEISGSSHRPVAEARILVKEEEKESQTTIPSTSERVNEETSPPLEENKSMEDNHTTDTEERKLSTSNKKTEIEKKVSKSNAPITHEEEKKSMVFDQETGTKEKNVSMSNTPITHEEEEKSLDSDQETGTKEKNLIIFGEATADVELNSSAQQGETKSSVSDQETGTKEEKNTITFSEPVADSTTESTISSTPQEETELSVSYQETGIEEKNTIIFGEIIADTTEINSSASQEGTEGQNAELVSVPLVFTKMQSEENMSVGGASEVVVTNEREVPVEKQDSSNSVPGRLDAAESNVHCDFTQERSDTCSVHGDIRVDGRSSSITVASPAQSNPPEANPLAFKIRPYSRKWEPQLMERIREFSVKTPSNPDETPRCTVNHTAPAIVFSTGGFLGNFFHDFTDVLIPLFITSRHYQGEVHFLVTDFNSGWISKYSPILSRLSRHDIVNADDDDNVHCFPQVHVGLLSHKELGVDASKVPNGYSVRDFRELLRSSYSLKRKSVGTISGRKPRLLIMLRKGSRALTNARQVVSMGKRAGFKVVTAGPEEAGRDLAHFARVVNSCDVMMGVHGAGLTNFVFLPTDAVLIQVVPWGNLNWIATNYFDKPPRAMKLRYLEYRIAPEESTLSEIYARDDPVFADPTALHRRGWDAMREVFLVKQSVRLDVKRFRPVLVKAMKMLRSKKNN